jgi:RNA polymerase sigma factor (sigma-70 family)
MKGSAISEADEIRAAADCAADRQALIIALRTKAHRLAFALLRRWGAYLEADEVRSAADLALCEAATRYIPRADSTFITYLFYFIKGAIARALVEQRRASGHPIAVEAEGAPILGRRLYPEEADEGEAFEIAADRVHHCPERLAYLREVRRHCRSALAELTPLEHRVVLEVHVEGNKVAPLARHLGYSRGHLFTVRKVAERKLRARLRDAA